MVSSDRNGHPLAAFKSTRACTLLLRLPGESHWRGEPHSSEEEVGGSANPILAIHDPDEPLEAFVKRLAAQAGAALSEGTTANRAIAAGHLARVLGRPAVVADLTSEAVALALKLLCDRGRQPATCNRVRTDLLRLGRLAAAAGQLEYEPCVPLAAETAPQPTGPWSVAELNLIMASARRMPDTVGELSAGHWWTAFLLACLETAMPVDALLRAPLKAYDRHRGRLTADFGIFALDARTIMAFDRIAAGDNRARLFPWPYDRAAADDRRVGKPYCMLYRAYRMLLYRASLPHTTENVFHRLRVTAERVADVIASIDFEMPFIPRKGKLVLPRPVDRRRAAARAAGMAPPPRPPAAKIAGAAPEPKRQIVIISAAAPERTLRHFYETQYAKLRLYDASPNTVKAYRITLNFLDRFLAAETHLCQLSDDLVQRFMAWTIAAGRSPARANGHRASILALWRFAWRKGLVDVLPRDIDKARLAKRKPRAWSMEQMGRILGACRRAPGSMGGTPAADWFYAFVLVIYDTGLRRRAALSLRSEDLDASSLLLARAETQKQAADQIFRLHPDTLRAVLAIAPHSRPLIFGGIGCTKFVTDRYRAILADAGLPSGPKDLFHKLRRTSATHYCALAGELATQRHLGHSSVTVTRMYLDETMLPVVHAADILPRPTLPRVS